jgi:hypothetical protein
MLPTSSENKDAKVKHRINIDLVAAYPTLGSHLKSSIMRNLAKNSDQGSIITSPKMPSKPLFNYITESDLFSLQKVKLDIETKKDDSKNPDYHPMSYAYALSPTPQLEYIQPRQIYHNKARHPFSQSFFNKYHPDAQSEQMKQPK